MRPETLRRAVKLHDLATRRSGVSLDSRSLTYYSTSSLGWRHTSFRFGDHEEPDSLDQLPSLRASDRIIMAALFNAFAFGQGEVKVNDLCSAEFMSPQ